MGPHSGKCGPGFASNLLGGVAGHGGVGEAGGVGGIGSGWASKAKYVVGGASHFFVGRTDRLVELAVGFAAGLAAQRDPGG